MMSPVEEAMRGALIEASKSPGPLQSDYSRALEYIERMELAESPEGQPFFWPLAMIGRIGLSLDIDTKQRADTLVDIEEAGRLFQKSMTAVHHALSSRQERVSELGAKLDRVTIAGSGRIGAAIPEALEAARKPLQLARDLLDQLRQSILAEHHLGKRLSWKGAFVAAIEELLPDLIKLRGKQRVYTSVDAVAEVLITAMLRFAGEPDPNPLGPYRNDLRKRSSEFWKQLNHGDSYALGFAYMVGFCVGHSRLPRMHSAAPELASIDTDTPLEVSRIWLQRYNRLAEISPITKAEGALLESQTKPE